MHDAVCISLVRSQGILREVTGQDDVTRTRPHLSKARRTLRPLKAQSMFSHLSTALLQQTAECLVPMALLAPTAAFDRSAEINT